MTRFWTQLVSLVSNFVSVDRSHDGQVLANVLPLTADMPCRDGADIAFLLLAKRCFTAALNMLKEAEGGPLPDEFGDVEMGLFLDSVGRDANNFWLDVSCFMGARPGRSKSDAAQQLFSEVVEQRRNPDHSLSYENRLTTLALLNDSVELHLRKYAPVIEDRLVAA